MVIGPPVAVNPLTVEGVAGNDNVTPESGTGLGMGTLKLSGPSGVVAGVAPLASIWVDAEPSKFGCMAAAAWASDDGQIHHRLVAGHAEGLPCGRSRRGQRGRGHGVVEHDCAHRGARAVQLVGAGEPRGWRRGRRRPLRRRRRRRFSRRGRGLLSRRGRGRFSGRGGCRGCGGCRCCGGGRSPGRGRGGAAGSGRRRRCRRCLGAEEDPPNGAVTRLVADCEHAGVAGRLLGRGGRARVVGGVGHGVARRRAIGNGRARRRDLRADVGLYRSWVVHRRPWWLRSRRSGW